jgi:hypothetical protein
MNLKNMRKLASRSLSVLAVALMFNSPSMAASEWVLNTVPDKYLSDEDMPPRTKPLLELGPKFLSTGNISKGLTLPTGAVWTPSLWVYGNLRSAIQSYDDGTEQSQNMSEWANRLDLFANLQLSGTERILLGVTPLHDRDTGLFSGTISHANGDSETVNELNFELDTLFFEGDLAELFPKWDYLDSAKNDIGFTIGRQGVQFMDGFLVNDNMDGLGFSKNNIRFPSNPNIINWRSSLFFGLDGINRHDNVEDEDSSLYGWFNQIDTVGATYNLDFVYVEGDEAGDLLNIGLDATRRIGKTNATFRAAFSKATDEVTLQADDGALFFTELSWVPAYTHDNLYLNGFIAVDNFTSAARGPLAGGPLGRTGLLFAAQGLGSAPAPLSNAAQQASGLALGYQRFSKDRKTQFTFETAARFDRQDESQQEYGLGLRWQRAMGHRSFWQIDAFATNSSLDSTTEYGIRLEFQLKL